MTGKTTAGTSVMPPDRRQPTMMRINQFAADIYPTVDAHLDAAKALESSLKKRDTRPVRRRHEITRPSGTHQVQENAI
jgi:hypothetical protein